jgi:hypothetical protein
LSIIDLAAILLVGTLFIMVYLLQVDPRFPILVSIAFLVASALFYYWDPNPWVILAFYSFIAGLAILMIERVRPFLGIGRQSGKEIPFLGKLDRVRNLRKGKGRGEP